jgi:outer membrane immunogenic protein
VQIGTLQAIHRLEFPDSGRAALDLSALRIDGGAFAGYNWRRPGGWVFGIEAEANRADFRSTPRRTGAAAPADPYCVCIAATTAVRLRLGRVWNRTLLYATAGMAADRMTISLHDPATAAAAHVRSWRAGWTVGLGVEHALRDRWRLRLDYRHADHGRRIHGTGFPETVVSRRVRSSELRLGLARRF